MLAVGDSDKWNVNVTVMWKLEYNVVQSRVFLVQYDDVQVMSYFNVELYQLLFSFFKPALKLYILNYCNKPLNEGKIYDFYSVLIVQ